MTGQPSLQGAEHLQAVEDLLEQELVVEAVLFTMGQSVELRQLAAAIGQSEDCAREAALRLKKRYDEEKRGLKIIALEDAFQMCTRTEYYPYLIRVASAPKRQVLTDVVLETLSIIAYQQPITKLEIEKIRGVKSDHAVNKLIEYNLVCEVGRLDAPGRPVLFATTEEFLRRFGIGSTEDLPGLRPEQEEEIKSEVAAELQMDREELEEGIEEKLLGQEGSTGEVLSKGEKGGEKRVVGQEGFAGEVLSKGEKSEEKREKGQENETNS